MTEPNGASMTARVLDPAKLAEEYRAALRTDVAALDAPLTLVGLVAEKTGPARTYAEFTAKGCASVGIEFEARDITAATAERAIYEANSNPEIAGVFLYYPIGDPESDRWLRELVDPRKDVEGMHSFWSRYLYENRRFVDEQHTKRAILPCTPLAILKLLGEAGLENKSSGDAAPLEGVDVVVFNRSDIVGRPLSAMLANDGAEVVSFDENGPLLFKPPIGRQSHVIQGIDIDRAEALRRADVVITGVPSREFPLIGPDEIKPGAICANFASVRNFEPSIVDAASTFIPRVGPMTVTMAMRNAVRLRSTLQ